MGKTTVKRVRFKALVGQYMALTFAPLNREAWVNTEMTLSAALEKSAIPFEHEYLDERRRLIYENMVHFADDPREMQKLRLLAWFVEAQLLSLDDLIDFKS